MGCAASIHRAFVGQLVIDLDHLFLTRVIGTGGFGTVYSAVHVDYMSWYAVKKVKKADIIKHDKGLDMILGELAAWKAVGTHAYIADLHFAFQDRRDCFFVMDLLTGADLRYYVKKNILLKEKDIAFIVACISSALHHIHSKGVLHRDVKPENIVFDHLGYPYLTDFGVAHICKTDELICDLSSGTKQYLAPEVFTTGHLHGPAADFWALGIVVYEVMFSRRPFSKCAPKTYVKYLQDELDNRTKLLQTEAELSPSLMILEANPCATLLSSFDSVTKALLHSPHRLQGSGSPAGNDTCLCVSSAESNLANSPSPIARRLRTPKLHPIVGTALQSGRVQLSPLVKGNAKILPAIKPSDKSALISAKRMGKLDPISFNGSVSAATTVMSMLKHEEALLRSIPPGKSSKYKLPAGIVFPLPEPHFPTSQVPIACTKEDEVLGPAPTVTTPRRPVEKPCDVNADGGSDSLLRQLGSSNDDFSGRRNNNDEDAQDNELNFSIKLCPDACDTSGNCAEPSSDCAIPELPDDLKVQIPLRSVSDKIVSPIFIDFLQGLLDIRPEYRLGGVKNYDRLVAHEWFVVAKLNWTNITEKKETPPFCPDRAQINSDLTHKYEKCHVDDGSLDIYQTQRPLSMDCQERFESFHHIADEYFELFPDLKVVCNGIGSGVKYISCYD